LLRAPTCGISEVFFWNFHAEAFSVMLPARTELMRTYGSSSLFSDVSASGHRLSASQFESVIGQAASGKKCPPYMLVIIS
jgi:hypothetical protein